MSGLFLIDRDMIHHPIVGLHSKDYFAMWIWLLSKARWKAETQFYNRMQFNLERGQVSLSRRVMARECGVTEKRVRTFLDVLESAGMLLKAGPAKGPANGAGATIVTICNYEKYQNFSEYRPTERPSKRPAESSNVLESYQTRSKTGPAKGPTKGPANGAELNGLNICNYKKYQNSSENSPTERPTERPDKRPTAGPLKAHCGPTSEHQITPDIILSNARARENDPPEKTPTGESNEPTDPFEIGTRLTRDCQQFAEQQASRPGMAHIPMGAQWLADGVSYQLDILPTVSGWLADGYGVGNWVKLSQKIYANHHARKEAIDHGKEFKPAAKSGYSKNSNGSENNRTCGNGFSEYVFAQRAREMGVFDNSSGGSVGDSGNFSGGGSSIIEGVAETVSGNDPRH